MAIAFGTSTCPYANTGSDESALLSNAHNIGHLALCILHASHETGGGGGGRYQSYDGITIL